MNTNLLKKLIRLANNNPNENEANLAARKVCKMIEEDNFSLVGGNDIRRRPEVNQPQTWNDIFRSSEPFWRAYKEQNNYYSSSNQTNYSSQEPRNKEDVFDSLNRTVTVNCRSCRTKFKMSYEEYFGVDNLNKKPRTCFTCK